MGFLDWLFGRSIEKRTDKFREDQAKSPWGGATCYKCGGKKEVAWKEIDGLLRPICIECDPARQEK